MAGAEAQLQKSICQLLDFTCPEVTYYHIPNGLTISGVIIQSMGEQKGRTVIGRFVNFLKSIGMKPGIPDLCLLWAPSRMCFVEVKSATGRVQPEQKEMHER